MSKSSMRRRATAFGTAGALVTATLIAGAVSAPAASAAPADGQGHARGWDREARGA
ncbi:alpha/beta hydrolase, partial [Streptomyces ardesiacus]